MNSHFHRLLRLVKNWIFRLFLVIETVSPSLVLKHYVKWNYKEIVFFLILAYSINDPKYPQGTATFLQILFIQHRGVSNHLHLV